MTEKSSFSENLSTTGSDLFLDPLSGLTRSRQNALLGSAVIAILLWMTIIHPREIEILGLTVQIARPGYAKILAGWVTVYFEVIYLFGVFQDRIVDYYRQFKPWAALNGLAIQTSKNALDILTVRYKDDEQVIREKYQPMIREMIDTRRKSPENFLGLKKELDAMEWDRKTETNIFYKLARRFGWKPEPRSQSGKILAAQDRELKALWKKRDLELQAEMKKLGILAGMPGRYIQISRVRTMIEIFFPLLLGLLAILLSLLPQAWIDILVSFF